MRPAISRMVPRAPTREGAEEGDRGQAGNAADRPDAEVQRGQLLAAFLQVQTAGRRTILAVLASVSPVS